jgi:transcriptional regulator with GAF, ATPase, and Fis domain
VILATGPELDSMPDLATATPSAMPTTTAIEPAAGGLGLEETEKRHIISILKRSGWRIEGPNGAARLLDMNPSTLRSRMKKLGIHRSRDIG